MDGSDGGDTGRTRAVAAVPPAPPSRGRRTTGRTLGRPPLAGEGAGETYDDAYGDAGYVGPGDDHDSYTDDGYGDDGYTDDGYTDDGYDDDSYGDDGYDDPDDRRGRRGCRAVLLTVLVIGLVVGAGGFLAWRWVQDKIDPAGPPGEEVVVEVAPGSTTSALGDVLEQDGVISSASVWQWYTRVNTVGSIQAGRYEMRRNSSFDEAIAVLEAGPLPPDARLVTVPEGYTTAQTAARLADAEKGIEGFEAAKVEAALKSPEARSAHLPEGEASVEGTLFPETYSVEDGDDEAALVQRMVAQFDSVMEELKAGQRAEALGLSPYEVIIVASLVEEETKVDDERAKVARVIYNRLERGEPLGIDATSCYPKGEPGCVPTKADLESDSPYNTRRQPGLPPTPIASPGRQSLEAALQPADGPWLYYVMDADADDGSHVFTDDYDEFLAARRRCQDAGLCG